MNQSTAILERGFSRASSVYDDVACLQKRMRLRLFECIKANRSPATILDIGIGTADSADLLNSIIPDTYLVGSDISFQMLDNARKKFSNNLYLSQSDAHNLPFKDDGFNIVISNATLHWAKDLYKVFCQVNRVLDKDGRFYFTIFGPDTLKELKSSFDEAYRLIGRYPKMHVKNFLASNEIIALLKKSGFSNIRLDVVYEEESYQSAFDLLHWLKSIGSTINNGVSPNNLWGKSLFLNMADIYEKKFIDGSGIKTTFEIFFVSAMK